MSRSRLELQGLAEFRAALRALPKDLADEAGAIVLAHADDAKRQIQTAYPEGPTGNLRVGVRVDRSQSSAFAATAIVRSRARHASLFEFGTQARQTRAGKNTGAMPKAPAGQAMLPIVIRVRRRMVEQLIALVRRAGFQVAA